ncbi:Glutathione-regulated potassium-efflux system protein KefC [bioreactor metagenome]|uniref:Glutathione-regulated potassium-efflux system protein KefC n=1 Tax=bioreactor metagenome TaxID=1076179 RepID=A0A645BF33_9ZZZZ|nr:TrkA family potassium uptake protein [Dehalobacterium formicoaceticum]
MKLFEKKKTDYTVIIGCGRFGSSLANALCNGGGVVLVIDRNNDAFSKIVAPSLYLGFTTLIGDATDIDVLREAQVEKATAVIVATNNDNTNIMIAQIVKELFKKERVIAKLNDTERECVYRKLGIDTISPAALFVKESCSWLSGAQEAVDV